MQRFAFFGTPSLACDILDALAAAGYVPAVVVTMPEKWLVTVLAAQVGEYAVNLGASAYPVDAAVAPVFPEVAVSLPAIADGLVTVLGASMLAAVEGGADRVVLCDTNGGSLPAEVAAATRASNTTRSPSGTSSINGLVIHQSNHSYVIYASMHQQYHT